MARARKSQESITAERRFFDPTERNPHNSYNQLGRHDNKFLPQSELEACAN